MKYVTDGIHSNSKATMFHGKVTLADTGVQNDNSFKELFKFFEKSFGRTNDIDAYVRVGRYIQPSEWSYRVSNTTQSQHQFFLSKKALDYFHFWYEKSELKWS